MIATTMKDIEKVYCNSYNHDVKAPVAYGDSSNHLYADAEHTIPVDCKLLEELFDAGVVIITETSRLRPTSVEYGDGALALYTYPETHRYRGYDTEIDDWQEGAVGPS